MRTKNESGMKESKGQDLAEGSFAGISSHTAEVPQVISEIINPMDDMFRRELEQSGAITAPRTIAAVAAAGHHALLASIVLRQPSTGLAVVYGGITCGDTGQMEEACDAISEVIERDALSDSGPLLSHDEKILLMFVVLRAAEVRKPHETADGYLSEDHLKYHRALSEKFVECVKSSGILDDGGSLDISVEERFPEFQKLRIVIDELRAAMVRDSLPSEDFFANTDPTVENYLKATYACTSLRGSPLQRRGLEFLAVLDAPLQRVFNTQVIGAGMGRLIPL